MITNTPNLIFLSGFMGTGKTTIGKALAARLKQPFLDLDEAIEEYAGRSIRSVFEDQGEEAFRKIEQLCLFDTISSFKGILALGGGALQNQQVVNSVKLNGLLIFIETPISVILKRIAADPDRPLLLDEKGRAKEHHVLQKELQQLYKQRLPLYKQAEITINSSKYPSVNQLVNELIKKIHDHVSRH